MDDLTREVVTRAQKALPVGTAFARFLYALVKSDGNPHYAQEIASVWRTTPQVRAAFELHTKAATAPGTSTDSVWAGPLVSAGITADVLQVLRAQSIVGALEGTVRRVPFNMKVATDVTTAVLGDWVVESAPTPVGALALATLPALDATKVAVIVPMTRELFVLGVPASEQAITAGVVSALAKTLDTKFLDPALVAATDKPGSITNGAATVTSTGSTAAAIVTDLNAMLAALTPAASNPVWIMRPTTAAKVSAALGTASSLPQSLYGIPAIISANSPAQITLLSGAHVLVADDGQFSVSISQAATLQLDTAPTSPVVAATVMTSLFQANLVAVRAVRWVNWTRVSTDSVVYMVTAF